VFPVRYELNLYVMQKKVDRLCGLVVRDPGYRSRGPGFDSRRTTEELLGRKSSDSGPETENTAVGIRHAVHVVTSSLKSWH
jgi:hypothetical protein